VAPASQSAITFENCHINGEHRVTRRPPLKLIMTEHSVQSESWVV